MSDDADIGELSDAELDLYGFVSSSKRRESVLDALKENPMTPKQIAERTDIRLNHISNVLSELADESLVICVNPERKRGRVYKLTELGDKISEKVISQ
jgi:predicted transcriptional regulator